MVQYYLRASVVQGAEHVGSLIAGKFELVSPFRELSKVCKVVSAMFLWFPLQMNRLTSCYVIY